MANTGIILTMAYPDTIVMVADEWYSSLLRYVGVGKKNYVRAGHAALVLINKTSGILEYHDFGRYITPEPNGRVRGKDTDHELGFPIKAHIENDIIKNLDEILGFLATHPKLTHGEGRLIASVCHVVDYDKARAHITAQQERHFIRYAAFIKDASNCARFVTSALKASVTNETILKKLVKSERFTPSTVGNVVIANTGEFVYQVTQQGVVSKFESSAGAENIRCFLDRLKNFTPNFVGTLKPMAVDHAHDKAQWLEGIAAGAWFELYETPVASEYRFRRISPHGNIDVDGLYKVNDDQFNYEESYRFLHYSNCSFYHIEQHKKIFRFDLIDRIN